jgi:hypothetical protein
MSLRKSLAVASLAGMTTGAVRPRKRSTSPVILNALRALRDRAERPDSVA